jgi:hypothetical protein
MEEANRGEPKTEGVMDIMMKRFLGLVSCVSAILLLSLPALAGQVPSFTDVTDSSGADDRGRGKGVAFADVDGDGDWDMFISNKGGGSKLYRNDSTPGHIRFTDVTAEAGLTDTGYCLGSVFADVDNDGRPDLFVAKGGVYEIESNRLLRNESTPGHILFRDVTAEAGVGTKDFTYGATFADIDNDGDLDLFTANYGVSSKNRLFRNDSRPGTVRFTEITDQAGVGARSWSWSASFVDANNDGWQDLYVVNGRYPNGEPNRFYLNNGDGTFRDASKASGLDDPNWGLGAAWADINGDGNLDVFLSNYVGPNKMFINDGTGRFKEVGKEMGLDHVGWGKGPTWGDVNHDGRLELYEGDCKFENQLYFWDEGKKQFVDLIGGGQMPQMRKNAGYRTKGTMFTDLDGDGALDLYVVNWNVPNRVYRNNQNDKNWLKVRLTGTVSNKMAVGSRVDVYPAGRAEQKGSLLGRRDMVIAMGFCSQPPQEVHFGLDQAAKYDVVVTFPSGAKEIVRNVSTGQILKVVEPDTRNVARK